MALQISLGDEVKAKLVGKLVEVGVVRLDASDLVSSGSASGSASCSVFSFFSGRRRRMSTKNFSLEVRTCVKVGSEAGSGSHWM